MRVCACVCVCVCVRLSQSMKKEAVRATARVLYWGRLLLCALFASNAGRRSDLRPFPALGASSGAHPLRRQQLCHRLSFPSPFPSLLPPSPPFPPFHSRGTFCTQQTPTDSSARLAATSLSRAYRCGGGSRLQLRLVAAPRPVSSQSSATASALGSASASARKRTPAVDDVTSSTAVSDMLAASAAGEEGGKRGRKENRGKEREKRGSRERERLVSSRHRHRRPRRVCSRSQ